MRRETITITVRDHYPNPDISMEVLAYVHPGRVFAVHRPWKPKGKGWTVTHLPTGLRIAHELRTRRHGLRVVEVAIATSKSEYGIESADVSTAAHSLDMLAIDAARRELAD